jgi:hypothetical protein
MTATIESILLISTLALGVPLVGGPCTYSKYIGRAVITRIALAGGSSSAYDAFFRFTTQHTITEDWAQGEDGKENPLSMISGIEGKLLAFHIKPGNSYVCTLSVITSGTCTPLIYSLKPPLPSDTIDTSSIWFWPDTVDSGKPFTLNLISDYFDCNTIFSNISVTYGNVRIDLWYHAEQNPLAGVCAPNALLYGIPFAVSGQPAGRFTVYSNRTVICSPPCPGPLIQQFAGWLVVRSTTQVERDANNDPQGPRIMRVNETGGTVEALVNVQTPGAASMEVVTPKGEMLGRSAGTAAQPGPLRLRCSVGRGNRCRGGRMMLVRVTTQHHRSITTAGSMEVLP